MSSLGDGSYVAPSKTSFGDYLDQWIEDVADSLRPLTVTKYRGVVRGHLKPSLGRVHLQTLRRTHFTTLYRELRDEGRSASTIAGIHAVAHRALATAVEADLPVRNPASVGRAAPKARGSARRAIAWSARELRMFLDHVADADRRLFPLWRLAAMTGMRRGSLGLTWQALDLDGGRLTVSQQRVPTRGGATFGPPKSKRSHRTVALDTETVVPLRGHREAQLLERAFLGAGYVDDDLVFCREDGKAIHPQELTKAFGRHRKAAGIPTGTLHVLRHTATTLALTEGVPLHVVAARIGDDPTVVLATYAHLLPTSDAEAAERIAALV